MSISMNLRQFLMHLVLACLTVVTMPAQAAKPAPDSWKGLQHMMTTEEFRAAGLDQLSPDQLARLNQWFLHFLAYDSQQVVNTDKTVQALQRAPLRHHIVGEFRGWSGKTVFTLDNGEVWQQRLPDRYFVSLDNPEVEIYKNLLGFYELKVVKTGRKIGVTRLK